MSNKSEIAKLNLALMNFKKDIMHLDEELSLSIDSLEVKKEKGAFAAKVDKEKVSQDLKTRLFL